MYGTTEYTLVDASDCSGFCVLIGLELSFLCDICLRDCLTVCYIEIYPDLYSVLLIVMYLLDWIGAMAIHVLRMYSV